MFTPPDETRISKIQVYRTVKFPDPYERFCGHQVSLSLDAIVGNEDPEVAVRRLQAEVDRLLDEHKGKILERVVCEHHGWPPSTDDEVAAHAGARLPGDHVEVSGHADPDD
jgi:hypothetical protein